MADKDKQPRKEEPIIVRKKKIYGGHGHHGGSWKVAYADFVTAMMAFFIVMWILGQSEQIKNEVIAYFKDPGAFNFITGKRTTPIDLNLKPANQEEGKGEGKNSDKGSFYFVVPPSDKDSSAKPSEQSKKAAMIDSTKSAARVKLTADKLKSFIEESMKTNIELKDLLASIKIELTPDGLRIELIETKESLFFQVGSSQVTDKAKMILQRLAKEIGKLPNNAEIEGHTDSRGYKYKSGYSNWDLSAERANSSRRILETGGFWEGQINSVTGFADRKLYNPQNPFDYSNRRISIFIRHITMNEFLKYNVKSGKQN